MIVKINLLQKIILLDSNSSKINNNLAKLHRMVFRQDLENHLRVTILFLIVVTIFNQIKMSF